MDLEEDEEIIGRAPSREGAIGKQSRTVMIVAMQLALAATWADMRSMRPLGALSRRPA